MRKYLGVLITLLIVLALSNNAWRLYQSRERLDKEIKNEQILLKKREELEEKVKIATDEATLDREVHDKLRLITPDQSIIRLPENLTPKPTPTPLIKETLPVYKLWLKVLFPDKNQLPTDWD